MLILMKMTRMGNSAVAITDVGGTAARTTAARTSSAHAYLGKRTLSVVERRTDDFVAVNSYHCMLPGLIRGLPPYRAIRSMTAEAPSHTTARSSIPFTVHLTHSVLKAVDPRPKALRPLPSLTNSYSLQVI
jgi:hypothetical protein